MISLLICSQKRPKLSALEELFAMEDMAIEIRKETTVRSTTEKIQITSIYAILSESSNLVVEHEGHSANAFWFGNKVSLCASIIHTLGAYVFYCWGHYQSGAGLSVSWKSRHANFFDEELLSDLKYLTLSIEPHKTVYYILFLCNLLVHK